MKKSIGIDLGTTNSVIAFKDTAVKIIRNRENEELTRSCVGLQNGEILVGSHAYRLLLRDPANTILSVKRLMGGAIKDKMVQDMIASPYYKFGITDLKGGTDDAVAVILGGKQYKPEQISAEILRKLKKDAEEKLGGEVTHAVITVPAYFTEKQKNATRVAAQFAGLQVKKILGEPTSAAIAYGVDNLKAGEATTILVYDFGGGTFDLSILNIVDGQYMEAGTGGDRWLGGDDIDRLIQKIIEEKVIKQYHLNNLKLLVENLPTNTKIKFEGSLRIESERAKIQLSSAKKANVIIDNILEDENGDIIDIDVIISRDEFEHAIRPYVQRSIDLIEQLLKEVSYDMSMIDHILLVGGSSSIPLVKQMLVEKYGAEKIKSSEKPMLAIAEGAGILAHRLGDEYEPIIGDVNVVDEISYSTNHNYYIEMLEGNTKKLEKIIEKQDILPISKTRIYKTTTANQKIAKVAIYTDIEEGETELILLGYYPIKENYPIGTELVFDFYIDTDEIFSVQAYKKGKQKEAKKVVLGRGGADHKALKTIEELIDKSVKEFKTIDGEEQLSEFISKKITEIDLLGTSSIDDNKWHEVYYVITEKFDEIKRNENNYTNENRQIYRAKALISVFGELLEEADKRAMIQILTTIESNTDTFENSELVEKLMQITDSYGVLNATLQIALLAERILELPGTAIGRSSKQEDVARLNHLFEGAKTKFLMKKTDEAKNLVEEAYSIIQVYEDLL